MFFLLIFATFVFDMVLFDSLTNFFFNFLIMPPTARRSVAFFYRKHLHGYKTFCIFAANFQSFFRFLMQYLL